MPIKKRILDQNLTKKGFIKDVKHDHIYYWYVNPKNETRSQIFTKISHGNKEIDEYLISHMSRQLHLSKKDFVDFVECHIDRAQYNRMMIGKGLI